MARWRTVALFGAAGFFIALAVGGWLWYTNVASRLTLGEALVIASLPGSACREQGTFTRSGVYNASTQTWWLDWSPSPGYAKAGCSPACVVNATSSAVEINWRCTGLSMPASKDDLISVAVPVPGTQITSPLSVNGEARGSWYFEAQFPVKLYDANGALLGSATAHASGDWMTSEYVPFTAVVTFARPATATGTLVLEKDNPSGLPQNADQLDIPVSFGETVSFEANGNLTKGNPGQKPGVWYLVYDEPGAPGRSVELNLSELAVPRDLAAGQRVFVAGDRAGSVVAVRSITPADASSTNVQLFYYDPSLDQGPGGAQCSSAGLVAVDRTIPKTATPLADTIALLVQGNLSSAEKAQGLSTEFPLPGFSLTSARIENGVATLAFADPHNASSSGGSCRAAVLWAQIEATAKQFPSVQSVQYKPATLFQP